VSSAANRREGGDEPSTSPGKLPEPTDHVFPGNHLKLFNGVLARTKLKFDRDGNRRTAYSLRDTYICMRLWRASSSQQLRLADSSSNKSAGTTDGFLKYDEYQLVSLLPTTAKLGNLQIGQSIGQIG
jgi:hypothetical protein